MQSQGIKRQTNALAMMAPIPKRKKIKHQIPSEITNPRASLNSPTKSTSSAASYNGSSPPKNLMEMKRLKKCLTPSSMENIIMEQKMECNDSGENGQSKPPRITIRRKVDSAPTELEESSVYMPPSPASFTLSSFCIGNIAEKVKLSRRKASLKVSDTLIPKPKLEAKPKKRQAKASEKSPTNIKATPKDLDKKSVKKMHPLRISLKMNLKKRSKLSITNDVTGALPPLRMEKAEKKPPSVVQIRRKKKKRATISDSSIDSDDSSSSETSSSEESSSGTSSSASDGSSSESEGSSSSDSSSSSGSSSDGSSSSDSDSDDDGNFATMRARGQKKGSAKLTLSAIKAKLNGKQTPGESGQKKKEVTHPSNKRLALPSPKLKVRGKKKVRDTNVQEKDNFATMRAPGQKKVSAKLTLSAPKAKLNGKQTPVESGQKKTEIPNPANERLALSAPKLKVRCKKKVRDTNVQEKEEVECVTGKCANPPNERPLTAAEIRAILGEDADIGTDNNWVRRSTRQPSRSAITAPNVRAVVGKLEMNDPEMVVLKSKKYLPDSDTPSVIVDALLDALERNANCQALYVQNFNTGMCDEQVLHLLRILQLPSCKIWCLNIGETYNVKRRTWAEFTNGLKKTKITHMYASEHTISSAMKEKIREIIRSNRKKHNMHIDPNNLDVIVQCTHCWWNPINARVLKPFIRQGGYEHILLDKIAQGTKDAVEVTPQI